MKTKKEPAKKHDPEETPPRRRFLHGLWALLGVVAAAEAVWVLVSFLRPRRPGARQGEFGALVSAGAVADFAKGSVTAFPRGHFYLARLADGGFLAISRRCSHLGCTVPWIEDEKRFVCPCHASVYDIKGGVLRAPAPRALDLFPIRIENNVVQVDTSRIVRRSDFRPEQVAHPESA